MLGLIATSYIISSLVASLQITVSPIMGSSVSCKIFCKKREQQQKSLGVKRTNCSVYGFYSMVKIVVRI